MNEMAAGQDGGEVEAGPRRRRRWPWVVLVLLVALVVGVPARRIGWMSKRGERLALPVRGRAEAHCPVTGERYVLEGNTVTCN